MNTRQSESGAILIAVLLVLTLLAGITAVLVRGGRNAAQMLEAEGTLLRRENTLRSALVNLGVALSPPAAAVPRDGRAFSLPDPAGAQVTVKVQAISGLINANLAPTVLLEGLFRAAGADPQTAQEKAAALNIARQQAPFTASSDLANFFSDDDSLWQQVRPALTIWGKADMLDPDNAPRLALLAVPGMTAKAADALIAARADATWPTAGRPQAELQYRPFLAAEDHGIYAFSLRIGSDRLANTGTGLVDATGRFHLIRLDWQGDEEDFTP